MVVLGVLAIACSGAERDDRGEIVGAGDVSAFEMRLGDCFDNPEDPTAPVSSLAAVPCEDPHDNQVFALIDFPEGGDAFPGAQAIRDFATDACLEQFEPFVGRSYEESRFDISALYPSAESWDQGDREVICVLLDTAGEPWTGTAEGRAE